MSDAELELTLWANLQPRDCYTSENIKAAITRLLEQMCDKVDVLSLEIQ